MVGLFNSFDLISFLGICIFSVILSSIFFPKKFLSFKITRVEILFSSLMKIINSIFNEVISSKPNKGFLIFFSSCFFLIFCLNFLSLGGYVLALTAQISLALALSFGLWFSTMTFGVQKNFKKTLSHLCPNDAPMMLISFLILIEGLSNLMRPFVLAIRLTANIFAGHLLMSLISSMKISSFLIFPLVSVQIMFLFLEMMVSMIQAYIFSLLSISYYSDIVN